MKIRKINKLKIIRLSLSIIITALLTAFFLDLEKILPYQIHSIAHLQIVPAILSAMSGEIKALLIILILILLFGRFYCSVICPLGVLQDFITWISKKINKKKRFNYTKSFNIIRYIFLIIMVITLVFGIGGILAFIEPYSIYGRVVTHLFKPIVIAINNILASFFEWTKDYYFREFEISIISTFSFIIAAISFVIVAIFSFVNGRKFCNVICPVGAILNILSRASLFKIRIDKEKCNSCGLCEFSCKAGCINSKEKNIEVGNCVVCFNCIGKCNKGSIKYKIRN